MSSESPNAMMTERPETRSDPAVAVALTAARPARVFLPALATGVLWWACHFPLNWSWLAWIALVPLLTLVRSPARPRRVYFAAWLGGLVFYWAVIQWMRYADFRMYFTWAALATYCSFYVPLTIFLVRRLEARTRWPLTWTFPLVWTALEYLRAHFGTGFPWYFLAHTQHERLWIIQISDLTGAYGVTFLVAAVNCLVFEWFSSRRGFRDFFGLLETPPSSLRLEAAGVALLLAAIGLYGAYRLNQEGAFEKGPKVVLVQGNIPQRIRNDAASSDAVVAEDPIERMKKEYTTLHEQAVQQQPDLIIWPETSFWDEWWEPAPELRFEQLPPQRQQEVLKGDPSLREGNWQQATSKVLNPQTVQYFRQWPASVLIGMNSRIKLDVDKDREGKHFNSAILLRDEREPRWFTRYNKIHRVPFGEYIPFRDWIPSMNKLSPYETGDYSVLSGEEFTRFALGKYHFGVLICFEDTDPYLARQYVRSSSPSEPAVDFLVNQSNDGWFDGSAEHDEHLAICRFRAVECRRSLARAVNMGISAVIDGNGRVIALPGKDWASSKKVSADVVADIPLDRRASLYAAWGDWLPASCWLALAVGWFGPGLRKRFS